MEFRREFQLPEEDQVFLNVYGLPWETIIDGSPWLLIHKFPTCEGYIPSETTAAIRIETGYPDAALDMVYFSPHVKRKDGSAIGATEALQRLDGRDFQRWSRHRSAKHPWMLGVDNIETHITLIEEWLSRELSK